MKCPACKNLLQQVTIGGVRVDVCVDVCKDGCGGMWFDHFELKKFDEPHESAGQILLEIQRNPDLIIDRSRKLKCPKCDDVVMMRHFFSVKKQVEVDECPGCGGFWLDAGELAGIRNLFSCEQERYQAAKQYFSEVFGEQFGAMKTESEDKLRKAQKITNIFRFICPSYYIPGKQDWGAF